MRIFKRLFVMFLYLFFLSSPSLTIAECSKNEIFNAYGFYNQGGFPEYTMLIGPFTDIEECQEAEKKFLVEKEGLSITALPQKKGSLSKKRGSTSKKGDV